MVDGDVPHDWKSVELCAPFLSGWRNGPSVCAPRRDAELGISRGAREGKIWSESDVAISDQIKTIQPTV